jgi:hypothetical protein
VDTVAVRITCPRCKGTGKIATMADIGPPPDGGDSGTGQTGN